MLGKLLRREEVDLQSLRRMMTPSVIYMMIYLLWWFLLEQMPRARYTVIHMTVDDYIPFMEVFVVPYLFWFFYITGTVCYFMLTGQKEDYYRLITFLFTGMTVFLIVSTFAPNIHYLRPHFMQRSNLFTALVRGLYRADTATNLWPSIHVYNSIGAHISVMCSERLEENHTVRRASFVTCVLITLSTMFIKQHSFFDVLTAIAMSVVFYAVVYRTDLWMKQAKRMVSYVRR